MLDNWQIGLQLEFLIDIIFALAAGFVIGAERESRGKPAGISTNSLVIGGAMLFTYLSAAVDPNSTSRIAAQVVSGIGFLGAGMILKGEVDKKITNLTTAASVWYSAAIGKGSNSSIQCHVILTPSHSWANLHPSVE